MGVNVRIDGLMLLTGAAVAVGGYAYLNRPKGDPGDWFNPMSQDNLANQAVTGAVGEQNLANTADYIFGAIDLVNPWNRSDDYATKVYGGGWYLDWIDKIIFPLVPKK